MMKHPENTRVRIRIRLNLLINRALVRENFLRLNQFNEVSFYKYMYDMHTHTCSISEIRKITNKFAQWKTAESAEWSHDQS